MSVKFIIPHKVEEEIQLDEPLTQKPNTGSPLPADVPVGEGVKPEFEGGVVKRGRGRPKGSTNRPKLPDEIEINNVEVTKELSEDKPKRGRPKKTTKSNVDSRAEGIFGAHQMLNAIIPGTAITESAAHKMAVDTLRVQEVYGIEMNEKLSSILALIATLGFVEYPVIKATKRHIDNARAKSQTLVKAKETVQSQDSQPAASVAIGEPFREGK